MKRVIIITTGGAISMKQGPMVGGAVPSLKGEDLLALLPRDVDLVFEEFTNLPGSHFMPDTIFELSRRVESTLMLPDVDGVVVTHGTDTLEETAYLLDLTIGIPKPVIVTGSLRNVTSPGYDGVVNLAHAIRLAASYEARDLGVLVVLHDEIHAASMVQQVHSHALNGFQSPGSGPIGCISSNHIHIWHRPVLHQYIPCSQLNVMVDLIRLSQGADDRTIRHSIADGVAGIVLETFGTGRVPPWWLPSISEALQRRIVVVATTRCVAGGLGDDYGYVGAYHDLRRLGVLLAHNTTGIKARMKLMVALGAARSPDELRRWFEG